MIKGKKNKLLLVGIFLIGLGATNLSAQQTGTCTAGTEFCESLDTNNDTVTNNTNVNTNTNNNTNVSTNQNTNISTSTNNNNNVIPIKTLQQTLTPIQTLAIQPLTTLTPTTTLIHLRLLLIQP
jgi:hypothetical protein